MADLAVIQGALSAWLATLVAATVALVTATALPRWVKVSIEVDGIMVEEADVGLWQDCRPDASNYNCSTLNLKSTTGQTETNLPSYPPALDLEVQCHLLLQPVAPFENFCGRAASPSHPSLYANLLSLIHI